MEAVQQYVQHNPIMALVIASVLLIVSGALLKQSKILAIALIVCASVVFYFFLNTNKFGKADIDSMKNKVKQKVVKSIEQGSKSIK